MNSAVDCRMWANPKHKILGGLEEISVVLTDHSLLAFGDLLLDERGVELLSLWFWR